jgi:transcriptional regulator with XRE-family HTH domain
MPVFASPVIEARERNAPDSRAVQDMKTVEHLVEQTGLSLAEISRRAGLPVDRVEAIVEGRWTPSPDERQQIAKAFGLPVDQISWGHSMNPRNIRYRRHGLQENF